MTMTEPLCNAVSYENSPYPCTRELGHEIASRPGMVRNKIERTHISKNEDGVVQMIWSDSDALHS